MREQAGGSLCPVGEKGKSQWRRLSVAIDSGACDNVANPEDLPNHTVRETKASQEGHDFVSATGETIPNLGEMQVPAWTREQTLRAMTFQAAPVTKPLGSVKKICKAGHVVVFDDDGSYIINKSTGEINMLREEGGNYMLDLLIPPEGMNNDGNTESSFPWRP